MFSRRVLGRRTAGHMRTELVMDALNTAIWTRRREGRHDLAGLIHHSDAGSQYMSVRYTDRLAEAGAAPSIGTVGYAYDNAAAESMIGRVPAQVAT
ncbi:DDE-type integrase/transposase/recombinase [Streptomyces sp. NPDC003038]|uniref:DDE-type integrase/transposase/recombinase n=1 Tax=unclassified Streptomyces TaxID=2593676 RepID=UPI0033BC5E2E